MFLDEIREHCFNKTGFINQRCNSADWWSKKKLQHVLDDLHSYTWQLPTKYTIVQRLYHYINQLPTVPVCARPECDNLLKWQKGGTFSHPYREYCSTKCVKNSNVVEQQRLITLKNNYGVDNPFKSAEVKNKIRQTNNTKYGAPNISNSKHFQQRIAEYYATLPESEKQHIQEKREATNLAKYGVQHVTLDAVIRKKQQATLLKNYGVTVPFQSSQIRQLAQDRIWQKFNRKSYQQTHLSTEFLELIQDRNWVEDQLTRYSLRDIAEEHNISYSHLCKLVSQHGFDLTTYSYLEKEVYDYIKALVDTPIVTSSRRVLSTGQELDIYLPEYKLAFECNGNYWHSELSGKKSKWYHYNKTECALQHGIRLLHIREYEWNAKNEIIKNIIRSSLNNTTNTMTVYARKCTIALVSSDDEQTFLDYNHIQGYVRSKHCYGLYYNNELVAVMSIGKPRFTKTYDYEVLRMCIKTNVVLVGGMQRLFSYIVKTHNISNIISYSNRELFTGDVYYTLGFTKIRTTSPGYEYYRNGEFFHRTRFQKHKLEAVLASYDPNLSEWDNMQLAGYDRYWDAGQQVFGWVNPNLINTTYDKDSLHAPK